MLEQALEALKNYDWGTDQNALKPIDEAIISSHGDAEARGRLEKQLTDALDTELSLDAKQFLCRKLMRVGSATCVPTLAKLLPDEKLSHMARYALERIPAPEAAAALRDGLSEVQGTLKIGVISSLGVRQDDASVPPIAKLLSDSDPALAQAAAHGLAAIRSEAAANALTNSDANPEAGAAIDDAKLACAESLLDAGNSKEALGLYKSLIGSSRKHVKLAATRGMLECAKR